MDAFHPSILPKPLVGKEPSSSRRPPIGYMAYEFLTKGKLFGQKFDPSRVEALPVISIDSKRHRPSQPGKEAEPSGNSKSKSKPKSYAEVANLLRSDGVHIQGVVNPTQWIQM